MPFLTIGMASYNNFAEVWFTVQALRLYQDLTSVEILVVDNYGDARLQRFLSGAGAGRYIRYTEKRGTAAPRDLVFREALGKWVMCIDPHVFLSSGAVAKFKAWAAEHPNCDDLLQGPLTYDDLMQHSDAWDNSWGGGMWGTWRGAQIDPDAPPYPIPMQGLGHFACRKDAWLGFNPLFAGFGGEEGYLHEKYRQAGRRVLCLPFFSWVHLFKEGSGDIPYPCEMEDRIRNYTIGFEELGLGLAPLVREFGKERVMKYITKPKGVASMQMEIIKGIYGGVDVTNRLRQMVSGNSINVVANNTLTGFDPQLGVHKSLEVEYMIDGKLYRKVVPEHGCLALPVSDAKKLGIFYSNNNDDKVVSLVLQNLGRVLKQGEADILTCTWRPVAGNPFPELRAVVQQSNHLNITLQILQLLYRAKLSGEYDYVSFLEHDVLYPEGYFDFPDFEPGAVLYNTNLKGVNQAGFQEYGHIHDSLPLHQMTMRFTDAIAHFERCIEGAMTYGQIMLEPELPRRPWHCDNPAIHINHGKNFTSHCTLYSPATSEADPYWGDYRRLGIFEG